MVMTIKLNIFTKDTELTSSCFNIIRSLGSGGFGTCYKATYKDYREVCLKKINRTSKRKAVLQSFCAETKKEFYTFEHDNIVKLLAASPPIFFENEAVISELFMVFELVQGQNLQSYIDDEEKVIDFNLMIKFSLEIASALAYVHAFYIAHLDVKPANVMVTNDDVCKLADFGCSQYINEAPLSSEQSCLTGTFAYRAPELLCGGKPSIKCDVYSLGICLWQLWSREFPFAGVPQHSVIFRVVRANLRPVFYEDKQVDTRYKKLAVKCWEGNPKKRPEMLEIIEKLSSAKE